MTMVSLSWRRAAFFAVPVLFLAAQAQAQDRGNVFDNLFSRGEPQQQQRQQAPAGGDDADLNARLDRLENTLRQMTGMIEQLQFRNQQLEAAFKRAQDDNEFRFQQLGAKGAPAPAGAAMPAPSAVAPQGVAPTVRGSPAALPPPAAPNNSGKRSDVFDPSQQPNAPGAPRALGGGGPIAAVTPAAPETPVGAPGGRAAGAPLDLSTVSAPAGADVNAGPANPPRTVGGQQLATLPPTQSPRDEYDLAYGYVLRKDYALAEQAFRDFVRKYPSDTLSPDASYWLGETLFQRQRYQDAADSFLVVVRNHEKSGKAPDALLRLGQSLAALGQKDMACASLNEVGRKYPKASAGVKRGVAAEQKKVHC